MNKYATTLVAACLAGTLALSASPASAQSFSFGSAFTFGQSGDWNDNDRRQRNDRGWKYRQRHIDPGLSFSIQLNSRAPRQQAYSEHVERCEDRFRSYDRRSDTYLGFDGDRHYCNL